VVGDGAFVLASATLHARLIGSVTLSAVGWGGPSHVMVSHGRNLLCYNLVYCMAPTGQEMRRERVENGDAAE
jgi:hypothetical protein